MVTYERFKKALAYQLERIITLQTTEPMFDNVSVSKRIAEKASTFGCTRD
jgi:hypothetical protein